MRATIATFALSAALAFPALGAAPADSGWFVAGPARFAPHAEVDNSISLNVGSGSVAGMVGKQAVYVTGNTPSNTASMAFRYGGMERTVSLAAFRGKRVRVTMRLKNEGQVRGVTAFYVAQTDGNGIRAFPRKMDAGSDWQTHQFVVDVPENADRLMMVVSLVGMGRVWVDGTALETVSAAIPVSETRVSINTAAPGCDYVRSPEAASGDFQRQCDAVADSSNVAPPVRDSNGQILR